jgi:hypothetical protein
MLKPITVRRDLKKLPRFPPQLYALPPESSQQGAVSESRVSCSFYGAADQQIELV